MHFLKIEAAVCIIGLFLLLPAVSAIDETDAVILRINGGLGARFIVNNNSPDDISAKMIIRTHGNDKTTLVSVGAGTTITSTMFSLGLCTPIDATLEAAGQRLSRSGYLIGVFVIFIG